MKYFADMSVYTHVHTSDQARTGGTVIRMKWVDTNKGDAGNPNYRSRLAGQDFRTGVDNSLYTGTPPLETLRYLLSVAATEDYEDQAGKHVMVS